MGRISITFLGRMDSRAVTADPAKLSDLRRDEIEAMILTSFAQVFYGHALTGSAQHHFRLLATTSPPSLAPASA